MNSRALDPLTLKDTTNPLCHTADVPNAETECPVQGLWIGEVRKR